MWKKGVSEGVDYNAYCTLSLWNVQLSTNVLFLKFSLRLRLNESIGERETYGEGLICYKRSCADPGDKHLECNTPPGLFDDQRFLLFPFSNTKKMTLDIPFSYSSLFPWARLSPNFVHVNLVTFIIVSASKRPPGSADNRWCSIRHVLPYRMAQCCVDFWSSLRCWNALFVIWTRWSWNLDPIASWSRPFNVNMSHAYSYISQWTSMEVGYRCREVTVAVTRQTKMLLTPKWT